MGEVLRAVDWFAGTGWGWWAGWAGEGIGRGYEVRLEARGAAMTVPKGAKAAGVRGSGWRRRGAGGLMDGRGILGVMLC